MRIYDMFADDINRKINGVIQVEQSDDDVIEQELHEYVITNELKKHFMSFFSYYSDAFDTPIADTGVWISGFFGSGKSHFLKMLSYILENREVKGVRTVERFREKFADDPATFMMIDKSTRSQTEAILFNIDVESSINKDKTAVLRVFAKMFYNHLGFYGNDLKLSMLEHYIEHQGKTAAFRQAFEALSGENWVSVRRVYKFKRKHIIAAMVQVLDISEADALAWFSDKSPVEFSIEQLIADIKEYVDQKPRDFRLLFMADEVGQYVGTDTDLLLNLQSIVEKLGSECKGKVWVICTGQEAIDEIIKVRADEFSRIQARFKTRLSLTSSSVDEVIQKRILRKKPEAAARLEALYDANDSVLRNLFSFTDSILDIKGYSGPGEFAVDFPFVPYQFIIMQKVFSELRKHGNAGKHFSGGERSMLSGFQEAAQKIQTCDEYALVPFFRFYDTVHTFLDGSIRRVIERCQRAADSRLGIEPQDVDVLKLLYLIRYIDDVKANLDNIVILMADDLRADKITMRAAVSASLNRLMSQNYIARTGDTYNFLTDEEQDIQREIRNTPVDTAAIVERIGHMIFADIYTTKKYRYGKCDFAFDQMVDGTAVGVLTGGMRLRFLTVATDAPMKSDFRLMSETKGKEAAVVLADTPYYESLESAMKIRKYVKQRNIAQLPKSVQDIIRDQQDEASKYELTAIEELRRAIVEGTFFADGEKLPLKGGDAKSRIDQALEYLVSHVYSNFLIYCPISYEKLDDNWLLDVQLYSEEFRADLVSIWMDEMHILSSQALRKLVKAYRKFFNAKDRRSRIAGLQGTVNTPAQLHLAIMAAICGLKNSQPASILRAVLNAGLSTESNSLYAELVSYGAKDAFWAMVAQATGYSEVDVDLGALACHVLMTACTRTMNADNLAGLERYISLPHQAWCFDLVSDWLHSDEKQGLYVVARHVEEALRLHDRFMQMQVSELADTECFPCINECILEKLMQDVSHQIIDADAIAATVEKRRTCVWYDAVSAFYDGMMQVANMQRFFTEHAAGFHTVEARNIWKEYTTDYYRMDGCYRQFHLCYSQSTRIFKEHLNDLFAKVAEQVEGLYVHWFLEKLGENWTNAIEDDLRSHGRILEVPQQTEFYANNVRAADSNVVVIISDALRYEVAASLTEQLRRETQSKIELTAMQGIFPTITKFGMAALLPHKKLTVEERANGTLAVLADDIPTDSNYREKVLRAANPNSIVIKCEDVIGKTAEQLRAETNGKEVVYIYHDTIDAASHASDSMVFPACETAIQELKMLIRHATNKLNRTHVFVTADHGFLYTYKPLKEDSKIDKTSFNQMDVEYGRRYAIMREGAAPDYLMPVRFMDGNTGLTAFTPRESMRIKMQGGGLNFVHGGVSLQELCVPLIAYHRLRNEYKEYQRHRSKYDTKPVTISLLSASRKISNMIFSLNFYQREAVGDNRCAQTYNLTFTDEYGKPISDTQKIIANKTGESNQDRTFRCTFNLKQLKYSSTATYYLVIADEQGLMMPQREEFHIDIAFAVDEFDFFS